MTLLGRALRQRARRAAGRPKSRRMVQARRRPRRPRGDVRAGDVPPGRPRRPARPRRQRQMARGSGQARPADSPPTIWRCSISRANCSRRILAAPPNCCASPPRPAIRTRNMRSALCTKSGRGVAQGHARGGVAVRASPRSPTIPTPKSSTPSRSITATASRKQRTGRSGAVPQSGDEGQSGGARPPRPHSRLRPRRPGRSGRRHQMAPDLKGARRDRSALDDFVNNLDPEKRAEGEAGRRSGSMS